MGDNGNIKAHLATVLASTDRILDAELILRNAAFNSKNGQCSYLEAAKNLGSLYGILKRHDSAIDVLEKCLTSVRLHWKELQKKATDSFAENDSYKIKKSKKLKTDLIEATVGDDGSKTLGDYNELDIAELYQQLGKHYKDLTKKMQKDDVNVSNAMIRNNLDKAAVSYEQCVNFNPGDTKCTLNLGHIYYDAGDYKKAKSFYELTLKLDPSNRLAIENLK